MPSEGMSGIMPTLSLNGDNCNCANGGWGNWGGALIGGAVGGAVGSAWNGNRWANPGPFYQGGCRNDDIFLMDSLSNLRNETSSVGRDQLMQTMTLQNANCQGFSTLNSAIRDVGSQMAVGQSRTEAAVYSTGLQGQIEAKNNTILDLNAQHATEVQNMRNTYDLKSSIDGCCCETNRNIERQGCETRQTISDQLCQTRSAIHAEGEATRALITQNFIKALEVQNCDLKSKVHQMETQQNLGAYINGVSQQMRTDMQSMLQTIVSSIGAATAAALNQAGLLVRTGGGAGTGTPA